MSRETPIDRAQRAWRAVLLFPGNKEHLQENGPQLDEEPHEHGPQLDEDPDEAAQLDQLDGPPSMRRPVTFTCEK